MHHSGELPAKVHRALHTHTESLSTSGQMDVRSITGQKYASTTVFSNLTSDISEGADPKTNAATNVLTGEALPRISHLREAG